MNKCRWLKDEVCANGASELCSTVPNEDDCKSCSHYFSEVDIDNIRNDDEFTEELI